MEQELTLEATVSKNEIVQMEGGRQVIREVEIYSLDAVIAVGYRVIRNIYENKEVSTKGTIT